MDLRPGDHLGCVYASDDEYREHIVNLLRTGLEAGQRVLYVPHVRPFAGVIGALGLAGFAANPHVDRGQLYTLSEDDVLLRGGSFDPDETLGLLRREYIRARTDGYPALRVACEMTCLADEVPGADRLAEFEAKLNRMLRDTPCIVCSLYDGRQFDARVLMDLLALHPLLADGVGIHRNPSYQPPEEFFGPDPRGAQLLRWTRIMAEHGRAGASAISRDGAVFQAAPAAILSLNARGMILAGNACAAELLGVEPAGLAGRNVEVTVHPHDRARLRRFLARVATEGQVRGEELRLAPGTGRSIDAQVSGTAVLDAEGAHGQTILAFDDITGRKTAEDELALFVEVLDALYDAPDVLDALRKVTLLIKEHAGVDAVGIRLREEDDFPYFEARGFDPEFVHAESHLCSIDAHGARRTDPRGRPILECMCGIVLTGTTDPSLPFFTKRGSFWTNSTSELLATTTSAVRGGPTRNRCAASGYETVGLIPLRTRHGITGLLQLNAHAKGRLTRVRVEFLERLADRVGTAVERRSAAPRDH